MRRELVVVCLLVTGCGNGAAVNEAAIREAQEAVSSDLIDPMSATFTDVTATETGSAVCGYVNAKNRLGGYTGKKRFVWVRGGTAQVEPEPSRSSQIRPEAAAAPGCIFDLTYRDCKGETGLPSVATCTAPLLGSAE